jgi:hypothetical protein
MDEMGNLVYPGCQDLMDKMVWLEYQVFLDFQA